METATNKTAISEGENQVSSKPEPVLSTEFHAQQCYLLFQRRKIGADLNEKRARRPARETLIKSIKSPKFVDGVLDKFLHGIGRDLSSGHPALTETFVLREADRLRRISPEPAAEVEPTPGSALLSWRHAFFRFWNAAGDDGAPLLDWVGDHSGACARAVRAFRTAVAELAEIDRLVAAGAPVPAFLAARRRVEAGEDCFATRCLALGLALPGHEGAFSTTLDRIEARCSPQFSTALRDMLEADTAGRPSPAETAIVQAELPESYAELLERNAGLGATGAHMALCHALLHPGPLRADPLRQDTATGFRVVLPDSGPPSQLHALAEALASHGGAVTRIGPAPAQSEAPVETFPDLATARAAHAGEAGALFVLTGPADMPAEMSLALAAHAEASLRPLTCTRLIESGDGALVNDPSDAGHRIGLYAAEAAEGWAALAAAGDDSRKAAAALEAAPVQFFEAPGAAAEDAAPEAGAEETPALEVVLLTLGGHAEEVETPWKREEAHFHGLRLTAGTTGAEAARHLHSMAAERGLAKDTPVVILSPEIGYDRRYPLEMARRFELAGRRVPVALQALRTRPDRPAVSLSRETQPSPLHQLARCSLMGMSCIGLAEAAEMLVAEGETPAGAALALFDLPAVLWPGGMQLTTPHWQSHLRALAAAPARRQRIFDRLATPMMGDLERAQARFPLSAVPAYMAYHHDRDATLNILDESRRGAALAPLRQELTNGGLRTLIEHGDGHRLRRAFAGLLIRAGEFPEMSGEEVGALLQTVQRLGLQHLYAEALIPVVPSLCRANFHTINRLFDFLAGTLDQGALAVLLSAILIETPQEEAYFHHSRRLLGVAAKYCSAQMLAFLIQRLGAAPAALFRDAPELMDTIGERLLFAPDLHFHLPGSGLEEADFHAAAAPEHRLTRAALAGERERALEAMRALGLRDGGLRNVRTCLAPVTAEAAALGITARDWFYPALGGEVETAALAAILGDHETARSMLPELSRHPELAALVAHATDDAAPLETLYRGWAEAEELAPLPFAGTTIAELFGVITARPPAPVESGAEAPLISVVMTVFEPEPELLRHALRSVLNQTRQDFEIFLIDDASSPEGRAATHAAAEMDPRIAFLETGANAGPYAGRNLALRRARGDFLAIQDGDDVAHPQRFERQIALFGDARVMATASTQMRFDLHGRLQFQNGRALTADGTMTSMFRRAVFDRLGPFAATRSRGDVEYRERIRKALGPAAFVETPCPLGFCYSAPTTLSTATAREKRAPLQQLRAAFDRLEWTQTPDGPQPLGPLAIPAALRP